MKEVKMPEFKDENEEADWLESPEGREFANQKLADARKKGAVRWGASPMVERHRIQKADTALLSIAISEPDIRLAKALAARKGIDYQTYISMLLHEVLQKEHASA